MAALQKNEPTHTPTLLMQEMIADHPVTTCGNLNEAERHHRETKKR